MTGHEEAAADDGTTFEEIPRDECFRLLAGQTIGRVAVADFGAAPLVVPVNFLVVGEAVIFRTDYGSKFRLAVLGEQPVSFQVDEVEPGRPSGWSVLLQGNATEVAESEEEHLSLRPWAPGAKSHWVRIAPDVVSGRRIRLAPFPGDDRGGYL
ncbi:MAG TPA: pyridoxamine 5'-phosphate oxidase family protein [Acidimicrobiales bacterium]|nr:pyridoxamine 5'-phosphate oxidase family protein [Acidimicrobiales bacterium]